MKSISLNFLHFILLNCVCARVYVFVCVYACVHECAHMAVRGQPAGVGVCIPPCRSWDQAQVILLGDKFLYTLSHLVVLTQPSWFCCQLDVSGKKQL